MEGEPGHGARQLYEAAVHRVPSAAAGAEGTGHLGRPTSPNSRHVTSPRGLSHVPAAGPPAGGVTRNWNQRSQKVST